MAHVEAGRKRSLLDAAAAAPDAADVLALEELALVAGADSAEVEAAPIPAVAAAQISNTANATCTCRRNGTPCGTQQLANYRAMHIACVTGSGI